MKLKLQNIYFSIFFLGIYSVYGQNVSLYHQFNGKYDFLFIGNTMNLGENNITDGCEDLVTQSSSATLNLNSNQIVEKAYLYWAGSGTGDFNIKLNGISMTAQRTFSLIATAYQIPYFSAFIDITSYVQTTGNGTYTLSDLDVTQTLLDEPGYCDNRTNFAGWAIVIVYKDNSLPINQLNFYDGLQDIPISSASNPVALSINLNSINVIDNIGAKIGFVAWEGDSNLSVNETLRINGNILSNTLNPPDNAFNGTNTFTGSSTLYNMDLDVYDIQNNINIGDTSAQIDLTSGQDLVMINCIVTKLNSELPDATVVINSIEKTCNSKTITVNYTIYNTNCNNSLPAQTPIAIYANGQLIGQTQTQNVIPVDGFENGQTTVTLPDSIIDNFTITIVVDDNGTGNGIVIEINENNNSFTQNDTLLLAPTFNMLEPLIVCNEGLTQGIFDFSNYNQLVIANSSTDVFIGYYNSLIDAQNNTNPILNTSHYVAQTTPKEIFIRLENGNCYSVTSFLLTTKNCLPTIPSYVTDNGDGNHDTFSLAGIRNIFMNFEIEIYNRWGRLIWTGNNNTEDWDGISNKGMVLDKGKVPRGTYFYILTLNDPDYLEPVTGWLYYVR